MTFQKTVGHEKQKRMFLLALENGRLAHAYAFAGEEGIGKTTFAVECAAIMGADPVLDLVLIDSTEPVSVEETRNLRSRLALSPAGKCKAAVIKAGLLTDEAASSILNLLEEPPAHSYIFLVTENFYSLLPTIASRVQKIVFAKSTDEEVRAIIPDEEIVKLAAGRIGFAKRLAENVEFLEFVRGCDRQFQILTEGRLHTRLQTAEKIAALETAQIKLFLQFGMRRLSVLGSGVTLIRKFFTALADLDANVNTKIAIDNLFLP
ncbi:MAG: hypothetical protein A2751_04190 [Candidatus Doudnabacteria bacterium RIFCSPHIGHO2_01_FULL_46_14]|uniref:DNA polymerase III subunit delta n=1 Tax=Candidatus Doudnabacteria bacterium RIFCSPHIGHO2_01_FULL_46_14 TaxID=1817824 RepID=A0A1F5NLD0_9BACT|nr:MAG: hypothetical protein A2751_04190 [Candidatus Doudnabacteria bacterium RIFCSPHIGHO2_01_FULL_46_14]